MLSRKRYLFEPAAKVRVKIPCVRAQVSEEMGERCGFQEPVGVR